MACSPQMKMFLLKYLLLLCVSCCMCQKDCTGVDCPVLENCIEEVLHSEECCATCEQTGCTCQGYQYYDCVHAGFKNGKVPEGESYFVDFGSTECSCPEGGGRISCHFIPCPEIPANCIAVSEPVDGCSQCERMGCVHGAQKYEAGHSFHMETCQVCHCPNEGGNLMCYPVPDCDPQKVQKPMLATTTEDSTAERQYSDPIQRILNHQGDKNHFIKTFSESYGENLPPFKLSPSHIDEDEDYDYPETSEPSLHGLASPTEPGVISVSYSENFTHRSTIRRGDKQELRERVAVHEVSAKRPQLPKAQETAKDNTGRRQISTHEDNLNTPKIASHGLTTHTERLPIPRNTTKSGRSDISKGNPNKTRVAHHEDNIKTKKTDLHKEVTKSKYSHGHVDTSNTLTTTDALQTIAQTTPQLWEETTASLKPTEGRSVTESQISSHTTKLVERDSRVEEKDRKVTLKSATGFDREHTTLSGGEIPLSNASHVKESVSLTVGQQVTTSRERDNKLERKHERHTFPTVRFSPTSQPPLRVKADEGHPPNKQSQSLLNFRGEEEEQGEEDGDNTLSSFPKAREAQSGPTAPALVESCCETGQRWAADGQPCNLLSGSTHSVCNVVQRQCCIGYVRESRCVAGMSTARRGEVCEEPSGQHCTEDSQQECCSCCTLGLQLRREGRGCEAHQYLSYPCGHVFLTCCEEGDEEETGQETGSAPTLRSKNRPSPTARPKKVSDREFPKQAFFMAGTEEAANSVEELEDVDECQRYEGQLCHHTCTNTWGSYECACHPGYTLQQDGHSCALEKPDEVNRVSAQHRPITVPSPKHETTSPGSTIRNACTGNGGCMHQCSVAGGLARCSCFPGFALNADGHSCEDVDECRTGTHNCSLGAICENQDGSYRCAPLSDQCDKGFTLNPSRECVDMNECLTNTHTCLASERCVNTMGAFVCERQISCPAGYQPRNGVCEDIDECMVRTHNCSPGMQCRNTDGSFFCEPKQRCLTGFTQDPHGNCIDINECSSVSEPCSSGFNCINTVGSYTCQRKIIMCSQGYHSSPDGARCVDVDECQTGTHRCAEGQICHNLPGSYRCDCQTGYQYDAIRQVCVDVNECWRYPGRLCAQTCENTPGSYQCSCTAGFSLAFDGKNCEDMNECDNNPCSQECANIYGSYQCYCRQGFFLKEDGHACEDIDECSQSIGNLCAFECVNVPGSYQCACPPQGYSMSPNGRTCRDIDECAVGGHNCSLGQTCYNIQGGFRCLSFDCPQNYRKVSDTRCERTSCPNVVDCQNSPLRITYYQLSFQTNIVIPAQIFRIGPSPAYAGDNIIISVPRGNEEGFFSTRRLNSFTGAVYLQRQVHQPRDFLIDVEMKLLRQGTFTTFLARIYVFITASAL